MDKRKEKRYWFQIPPFNINIKFLFLIPIPYYGELRFSKFHNFFGEDRETPNNGNTFIPSCIFPPAPTAPLWGTTRPGFPFTFTEPVSKDGRWSLRTSGLNRVRMDKLSVICQRQQLGYLTRQFRVQRRCLQALARYLKRCALLFHGS